MFERWDEVELDLRVEATLWLDAGAAPPPLLIAFAEHGHLATAALRPFDDRGVLPAVAEVLAALLPLGASRFAVGLPGEVDATPAPDEGPEADVALVVATARTRPGGVACTARLLPLAYDGSCWRWLHEQVTRLDAERWDLTRDLARLLSVGTRAPAGPPSDQELTTLHARLGRCQLLGHGITLAPAAIERLEPTRLSAGDWEAMAVDDQ